MLLTSGRLGSNSDPQGQHWRPHTQLGLPYSGSTLTSPFGDSDNEYGGLPFGFGLIGSSSKASGSDSAIPPEIAAKVLARDRCLLQCDCGDSEKLPLTVWRVVGAEDFTRQEDVSPYAVSLRRLHSVVIFVANTTSFLCSFFLCSCSFCIH
jgi:hypothetical protein